MESYLLYITIASATIASPGPGIVLTVSNSISYGFKGAVPGIAGVAIGMLCIAIMSATSLAVILATSALAFTVLKYIGAAYLIYLGIKMWCSSSTLNINSKGKIVSARKRFIDGFLITLLNPKPIFFFMALFPQFINPTKSYTFQFFALALTFSALVVIIHFCYALFSQSVRVRLSIPKGSQILNKISGGFYMFFGVGLAVTNK